MRLARRIAVLAVLLTVLGMSQGGSSATPFDRCVDEWNACTAHCDTMEGPAGAECRNQCWAALQSCTQ